MENNVIWKKPIKVEGYIDEDIYIPELEKLINAWDFIILRGYAGIGKTYNSIVYGAKNNYDIYIFECSSDMSYYDVLGGFVLKNNETVYNASSILSAVYNSQKKKTLLIIDEINLLSPAVLKALNSLFDFRKSIDSPIGRIMAGELKIIATMNKEMESAGYPLDIAVQSRAVIYEIDIEKYVNILKTKNIIDDKSAEILKLSKFMVSIRELQQVKALITAGFTNIEALNILLMKYDIEKRKQIKEILASMDINIEEVE